MTRTIFEGTKLLHFQFPEEVNRPFISECVILVAVYGKDVILVQPKKMYQTD